MGPTEKHALLVHAPTALLLGGEGSLPPQRGGRSCHTLAVALDYHVHLLLYATDEAEMEIITGAGWFAEEGGGGLGWRRTVEAIRAATRYFGIEGGMRIEILAEVPPHAGIGTQAAAFVAAVKGLALWSGLNLNPPEVAVIATEVARTLEGAGLLTAYLYASAFGGIHRLHHVPARKGYAAKVEMETVEALPGSTLETIGLLFLPPGEAAHHPIAPIWQNPATAEERRQRNLERLQAVETAWRREDQPQLAALLDAISGLRETAFVDPPVFRRAYHLARQEGAWGGFLAQDGAGSSLLILAAAERHTALRKRLGELGLSARPLRLDRRRFTAFAAEPWRRRIARRGRVPLTIYPS